MGRMLSYGVVHTLRWTMRKRSKMPVDKNGPKNATCKHTLKGRALSAPKQIHNALISNKEILITSNFKTNHFLHMSLTFYSEQCQSCFRFRFIQLSLIFLLVLTQKYENNISIKWQRPLTVALHHFLLESSNFLHARKKFTIFFIPKAESLPVQDTFG